MENSSHGPVIATLRVSYAYRGLFGLPWRLSYPLGRLIARRGSIDLRPPRLLSWLMRALTISRGDVIDTRREGLIVVMGLRDGSWVRVGSPQGEELVSVLMTSGIPVLN